MTLKDDVRDIVTLTNIFTESEEVNGFSDLFEYEKYESEKYDTRENSQKRSRKYHKTVVFPNLS